MTEITEKQIFAAAAAYIKPFRHQLPLGGENAALADFVEGAKWIQQQQPKWISVEDRLPEVSGWYLVCFPNVQASFFYIEPDYKGEHHKFTDKDITHWMPLPDPPTA